MERLDLVPAKHRRERVFLLDVLAGREREGDIDPDAFLAVTPQGLYPYLHWQLARRPVSQRLLDVLAAHYRTNAMLQLRRSADLRRVGETLEGKGIKNLVLKGPVLAATVYPHPATRTMIDLDLLVHEHDLERAMVALEATGYRVPAQFIGVTMEAGDAPPLVHEQPGSAVIELHTMLDSAPDDPQALESAWATARSVELGHGLTVRALDRGELFAHVVAHLSRHHRFEGGLRSLLDVALLLRSGEAAFDWEEWERRRIADWIALTLHLANILLDAPIPDAVRDRRPSDEALALAAEQLWSTKTYKIPPQLLFFLSRTQLAPVHDHAHAEWEAVPVPTGVAGLRARAERDWKRVVRLFDAFRRGALRPRNLRATVDLFRKRERLFALMEKRTARPPR